MESRITGNFGFQSTPPREGRFRLRCQLVVARQFQSTPPREGRYRTRDGSVRDGLFQSTPPREGRCELHRISAFLKVSIHAPARGAIRAASRGVLGAKGFNPRPRARGDGAEGAAPAAVRQVSIHAPARGAIEWRHAFRWLKAFQSTPPREGRFRHVPQGGQDPPVSIHAPARGAMQADGAWVPREAVSIHAPARGAMWRSGRSTCVGSSFNPRPRARGDSRTPGPGASLASFNPRPRARGDLPLSGGGRRGRVSIHAPARGAMRTSWWAAFRNRFQSTPPREGRSRPTWETASTMKFQSTPPREGRFGT